MQNLSTWDAMPPGFIVAYQIHAVPRTKFSRPDHVERSGTLYYVTPTRGQKGISEMPEPPYDRENGRLVLKHNCRCYLSPVFVSESNQEINRQAS